MKDWIGDGCYQNYEADLENRAVKPRLGDVKRLIIDYCILPLGSKEAHAISPLVRSVCICGPPRYGKEFLVNAISSETGALLFDLSPSVLAGKFEGKKEQKRLIDMVDKVSRAYAPSVIYINGGEKLWYKKVPQEEKHLKPKRFAKLLPKLVKRIKPGDQVICS